jgi:hypothetical protein
MGSELSLVTPRSSPKTGSSGHFAMQTGRTGALAEFLEDHKRPVDVFRTRDVTASREAIAADASTPFFDTTE